MEKLRSLLGEAKDKLDTADHLTYVTYPSVNEVKMLYSITDGIAAAVKNAMKAVVRYDRLYKRVPLVPGNFRSEFEIFRDKCARRYNIDKRYVAMIAELHRIVELRKKSPMEFVRRDRFIICTQDYKMKELNLAKVKEFLSMSKKFVNDVSRIVKC